MITVIVVVYSLLSLGSGNRRTAHVRSKGFARVLVLSKKDLHETLEEYPDAKQALKEKASSLLRQDLDRHLHNHSGSRRMASNTSSKSLLHVDSQRNRPISLKVKENRTVDVDDSQQKLLNMVVEEEEEMKKTNKDGILELQEGVAARKRSCEVAAKSITAWNTHSTDIPNLKSDVMMEVPSPDLNESVSVHTSQYPCEDASDKDSMPTENGELVCSSSLPLDNSKGDCDAMQGGDTTVLHLHRHHKMFPDLVSNKTKLFKSVTELEIESVDGSCSSVMNDSLENSPGFAARFVSDLIGHLLIFRIFYACFLKVNCALTCSLS